MTAREWQIDMSFKRTIPPTEKSISATGPIRPPTLFPLLSLPFAPTQEYLFAQDTLSPNTWLQGEGRGWRSTICKPIKSKSQLTSPWDKHFIIKHCSKRKHDEYGETKSWDWGLGLCRGSLPLGAGSGIQAYRAGIQGFRWKEKSGHAKLVFFCIFSRGKAI